MIPPVILEARGISKSFRGLKAVSNASFEIPEGRINALIGPNSVPTPPITAPRMSSTDRAVLKICSGNRLL